MSAGPSSHPRFVQHSPAEPLVVATNRPSGLNAITRTRSPCAASSSRPHLTPRRRSLRSRRHSRWRAVSDRSDRSRHRSPRPSGRVRRPADASVTSNTRTVGPASATITFVSAQGDSGVRGRVRDLGGDGAALPVDDLHAFLGVANDQRAADMDLARLTLVRDEAGEPGGCATMADCMAPAVVGEGLRSYAAAASNNALAGIRSASAATCATRRSTSDTARAISASSRATSATSRASTAAARCSAARAAWSRASASASRASARRSSARPDWTIARLPAPSARTAAQHAATVSRRSRRCWRCCSAARAARSADSCAASASLDATNSDSIEPSAARVGRCPGGDRFESGAAVELCLVASGISPRVCRGADVADEDQCITVLVDPGVEPVPRADQCFVGDLDGRLDATAGPDRTSTAGLRRTARAPGRLRRGCRPGRRVHAAGYGAACHRFRRRRSPGG